MPGFNKIVPEIIQSSIWNESSDIRIVWIAMLATKDQDGYVRGDARTIARMANVSVEAAEEAIRKFQEPDPNSHTPTNDGRRIVKADGGYMVINSDLYREIGMTEQNREYWREKQRLHREKKAIVKYMSKTSQIEVKDFSVSVSASVSDIVLDKGVKGEKIEKPKTYKQLTREEFLDECEKTSNGLLEEEEAGKFFLYWSEKDAKGKMRFQKQETWETKRRMMTWRGKAETFNAQKGGK
jgi:hypothetical protein